MNSVSQGAKVGAFLDKGCDKGRDKGNPERNRTPSEGKFSSFWRFWRFGRFRRFCSGVDLIQWHLCEVLASVRQRRDSNGFRGPSSGFRDCQNSGTRTRQSQRQGRSRNGTFQRPKRVHWGPVKPGPVSQTYSSQSNPPESKLVHTWLPQTTWPERIKIQVRPSQEQVKSSPA